MREKLCFKSSIIIVFLVFWQILSGAEVKYAGARSSDYGINPFPTTQEWGNVMQNMASYFPGSTPTGIWIVGTIQGANCAVEFPYSGSASNVISHWNYTTTDKHESYLAYFDAIGVKVYLQVESAMASVDSLIDIVLNQYKQHPCVVGFGVDVEWYLSSGSTNMSNGISDVVAQRWDQKIKQHNASYKLFLKHWMSELMPPSYRNDIVFIDDSQGFPDLDAMANEFKVWADHFAPNIVMYQIGYDNLVGGYNDYWWWKNYLVPPQIMGETIAARITNSGQEIGIAWVDFTLRYSELDLFADPNGPFTPVISDIPDQKIEKGESFSQINLDTYVYDQDNSNSELTWSVIDTSNVVISIDASHVATVTVKNPDWIGSETVTFIVTDPDNLSDSDYVTFIVTPDTGSTSEPPVVSDIPNQAINEGQYFSSINLNNYVSDNDNTDDEITWTYSGNSELDISISPGRIATITLPNNQWNGSETVTFTATDPDTNSDSDGATFTVNGVNDAPVITQIPDQTITQGGTFPTISLDDYVTDPDNDDSELTWEGAKINKYKKRPLTVTVSTERVASVTVDDPQFTGICVIEYKATDPGWASAAVQVTYTVREQGQNSAPTDIIVDNLTVSENVNGAFIGFVTVVDPDSGDVHTFTIDDNRVAVIGGQLKVKDGVTLDYETSSSITIEITATDIGGLSVSKEVSITVSDINEAPTDIALDDQSVNEKEPGAIVGQTTVNDQDAGDSYTLSVGDSRFEFSNSNLKLKDNEELDYSIVQSLELEITATDNGGLQFSKTFTIVVNPVVAVKGDENTEVIKGTFIAYPNPVARNSDGKIILSFSSKEPVKVSLKIYDAVANIVYNEPFSLPAKNISWEWNLRSLMSGEYVACGAYLAICVIKDKKSQLSVKKIMIGVKE